MAPPASCRRGRRPTPDPERRAARIPNFSTASRLFRCSFAQIAPCWSAADAVPASMQLVQRRNAEPLRQVPVLVALLPECAARVQEVFSFFCRACSRACAAEPATLRRRHAELQLGRRRACRPLAFFSILRQSEDFSFHASRRSGDQKTEAHRQNLIKIESQKKKLARGQRRKQIHAT